MNIASSSTKKMFYSNASIAELHLSIRSTNVLLNNNIHTIGELVELLRTNRKKLKTFRNLGKKSEEEICSVVDNIIISGVDDNLYANFISNYNFSKRALSVFASRNIKTISELKKYSIIEIKNWKNIGKQTLDEIIDVLSNVRLPDNLDICEMNNDNVNKAKIDLFILQTNNQKDYSANNISIQDYNFSTRTLNVLQSHNIHSIAELKNYSLDEIKCWRNLGSKTFDELLDALSQYSEIKKSEINIGLCISENEYKFYKIPIDIYNEIKNQSYITCKQLIELFDKYETISYSESITLDILFVSNQYKETELFNFCENVVKEYNSFFYYLRHTVASVLVCIIKCIKLEKLSNEDVINYHPSFCNIICSDNKCIEIIKSKIFDTLSQLKEPIEESRLFDLYPVFLTKSGILSSILMEMEKESLLKKQRNMYEVIRPSVSSYIKGVKDKKIKDILTRKIIKGQTLEEIGAIYNVSRERIRQIVNKYFIKPTKDIIFAEDEYAYIYKKYKFSKDQSKLIFGELTSNYFQTKYDSLDNDLEDCLDDKTIPENIRRKIRTKIIYTNYIYVGNQYVKKYRPELYRYYIKRYCTKDIELDDFITKYREFWEKQGLPKELYDMDVRTIQNKISLQSNILYKYPRTLRFYDFKKYDFTELLDTLNLSQYENVLFSTAKFVKDYPKLMKKYDLHDEYELHNLLRYLLENKDNNITFHRMPIIEFGKADVDNQVISLLNENAPISPEKLSILYEEKYGNNSNTVLINYFKCINKYLHRGIYIINAPNLSNDEVVYLKQQLKNDFYTIKEVEDIFKQKFSELSHLNPISLKKMGFIVNVDYIVQGKYESAKKYFEFLLFQNDKFLYDDIPQIIRQKTTFNMVLNNLLDDYELLEYDYHKYITFNKLKMTGIKKEDLFDFCKKISTIDLPDYFTMNQIKSLGFKHKLFDLGFDDWFYEKILAQNDNLFSSQQIGGKIILSKGEKSITWISLLEDMIPQNGMDIYRIVDKLNTEFGINIDKNYILERIYDSDLYYDKIMEKIYRSYDDYFEEI